MSGIDSGWWQPVPVHSPGPPNNNKRNLAIVLSIGALALAGVIAAVVVLANKHGSSTPQAGSTTTVSGTSTATAAQTTDQPSSTTQSTQAGAGPVVAGWQTLTDHGASVDVPPDWTIKPASDDNPHVSADYKEGACVNGATSWDRAEVMVMSTSDADMSAGAAAVANRIMSTSYTTANPRATLGRLGPANAGGFQDLPVTIALTPDSCAPATAVMHVLVHAAKEGGTFAVIVVADRGVPFAMNPDDVNKIASSARAGTR